MRKRVALAWSSSKSAIRIQTLMRSASKFNLRFSPISVSQNIDRWLSKAQVPEADIELAVPFGFARAVEAAVLLLIALNILTVRCRFLKPTH